MLLHNFWRIYKAKPGWPVETTTMNIYKAKRSHIGAKTQNKGLTRDDKNNRKAKSPSSYVPASSAQKASGSGQNRE